jgi:hypothetical protein
LAHLVNILLQCDVYLEYVVYRVDKGDCSFSCVGADLSCVAAALQVTDVPGPNTMRRRFLFIFIFYTFFFNYPGLLGIGMFHSYSLKSENCSYYESCSTQKAWMIEQENNKVIIHLCMWSYSVWFAYDDHILVALHILSLSRIVLCVSSSFLSFCFCIVKFASFPPMVNSLYWRPPSTCKQTLNYPIFFFEKHWIIQLMWPNEFLEPRSF